MKKPVLLSLLYLSLVVAYIAWPTPKPANETSATEEKSTKSTQSLDDTFPGTVPNRDAAIEQAKKDGKKTYRYVANFVPGIGIVNQQSTTIK